MTTTTQDLNLPVEQVDVGNKKKGSKGSKGSTTRGGSKGK